MSGDAVSVDQPNVRSDQPTAGSDTIEDTGPTRCANAADCDDGITCTDDACGMDGMCTHVAVNRRCDDQRFCNGIESCNVSSGCMPGTAPSCDDMNPMTGDRCDEALNACRNDPVDMDGDGDPPESAGGHDCDDNDPTISSLAREVCNRRDDNCNGMIDEGALNACGNCDPNCRASNTGGMGGRPFSDPGRRGVEFDPMAGGLLVRAEARTGDYLWIPNTNESTMSKWDAATGREIARYRVGLPAGECRFSCCYTDRCNMVSRVAIDSFGDAYIASRAFAMQGSVTKVAADTRDCIDRNMNGMIDTSTGAADIRPYGQDECVIWTANAGPVAAVLRAIAIDRGDVANPGGYVWAGGYSSHEVYKLDPSNGRLLATVNVGVNPYGAVVTSNGRLWVSTLDSNAMVYVDTTRMPPTVSAPIPFPLAMRGNCGNAYGVTADSNGRVWMAGWGCRDAIGYDQNSGQWTRVDTTPLAGGTAGRGITPGPDGYMYMAVAASGDNDSRVVRWRADDFVGNGTIPAARVAQVFAPHQNGPSGLGFDRLGNIWLAHYQPGTPLVRYVPMTGVSTSFMGPNQPYTYSDFTGSVRRTVIGTGTYTEEYDTQCANPTIAQLDWDSVTPMGTSLNFNIQTADNAAGLGGAPSIPVASAPINMAPVDVGQVLAARMPPVQARRFVRLTVIFNPTAMPISSPVLRRLGLAWRCPYNVPQG